jgi:hypothetical protein
MSQDWHTPKELAGLPGMPGTVQGIHVRAKRDNWESRKRTGRGGGREYAFASLPVETQAALLKDATPEPKAPKVSRPAASRGVVDRESLWASYERRPQGMKDEAARRLQALQAVERLVAEGQGKSGAVEQIATAFGESRATLYRWQRAVKGVDRSDRLAALVPGYVGRTAKAECSPEAWEFFKAIYLRPGASTESMCYEWTRQAAEEHGWTWPSKRTIYRWVKEIPLTTRTLMREGEYALMRLYPSQQRTVRDLHAMYWINGDGYQHNVFVKMDPDDPNEKPFRPKTWFWQDIYSRRIVGFRTDHTEHTDMIRLALGDVIERYGIPEHATIDNTRAAANKWMTGGVQHRYRFKVREEDPLGLMPQLGIQVHWTTVHKGKGWGQAKPVERAFGVGGLGEWVDAHPKFHAAGTGPNPMAKPDNYGERVVSWDDFMTVLRTAIAAWNAKDGRRTEICAGQMSFDQAFDESYQRSAHLIRKPTEAQRRMWMLAAESVTVQRGGSVALAVGKGPSGKNRYSSDALIEHVGRKVVVRFDPDDLHGTVYLYQADGRYIGPAECDFAVGFGDSQKGREHQRIRKQKLKAAKQMAEAESRMTALEAAELMPEYEPEPDEPVQTNVIRGAAWKQPAKRVAGSDVNPGDGDDESPADRHSFDDFILGQMDSWKKKQI